MTSELTLVADVMDEGLDLAGVLLSSAAIGSGLGVTVAVLEKRPLMTIGLWGFKGTALDFALGFFLVICALASQE